MESKDNFEFPIDNSIRVYDNDLTRHQVLNNWIADTQVVETMLERYSRNHVFDMFPTFMAGSKWFSLPYDFDTAIGINNEGALVFSYNLEDIDHTESGADIYNGQQSVLWVNVRQAFYEDIKAMYQKLRSNGTLSFPVTEQRFEEHQAKWPEAVFNEDAYFKYLQPLVEQNTASYLTMLQGSKAEQRKWWLYNRFRYLDSKYNAGDALTDSQSLWRLSNMVGVSNASSSGALYTSSVFVVGSSGRTCSTFASTTL